MNTQNEAGDQTEAGEFGEPDWWSVAPTSPEGLRRLREQEAQRLGNRLRSAREAHKWHSRHSLARHLQVHENTIAKFERGESVPDALQVLHMAAVLGTTPAKLLGLSEAQAAVSVHEQRPNYAGLNTELLSEVMAGVKEALGREIVRWPPQKLGLLIGTLYEEFVAAGKVNGATVLRLVKLAS